MTEMLVRVELEDRALKGELAMVVAPGTSAGARDRVVDRALAAELGAIAENAGAVLVAAPSKYAFVQPGKDAEGRTRFVVSGKLEGERLVPCRPPPPPAASSPASSSSPS